MNKIFYPPQIENTNVPGVFLAGPIQGVRDWQAEAIEILSSLNSDISIYNPRRKYLDGEFIYDKQVDWETYYLRQAAKNGVILFWLAKEDKHNCERAYAQTSRFELSEWKVRHERDGIKLVIGIEDGFTGARYIRRRFSQDSPNVSILDSLKVTCEKVVDLLR